MNKLNKNEIKIYKEKIFRLNEYIYNKNDLIQYLKEINLNKSLISRFFCWFISLNIIKINNFSEDIINIYHNYIDLLNKYFGENINEPLKLIKTDVSTIKADISRSIFLFKKNCNKLNIEKNFIENSELIGIRILSLLTLSPPNFIYTQGFDRYMFNSYILCLNFVIKANLPLSFVEALSFYLTKSLLELSNINEILDNINISLEYFEKLNFLILKKILNLFNSLKLLDQNSFHFALRWRLLLFSDEHDIFSIFLIWDQFILNKNNLNNYFYELSINHLKQIQFNNNSIIENIQRNKNWNINKLLIKNKNYNIFKHLLILLIILFIYYKYR